MTEINDFKIEGFEKQIEILKENKELDGTITRKEIADLQRSISLIKYGIEAGQNSKKEEKNNLFNEMSAEFNKLQEERDTIINTIINDLEQQLSNQKKEILEIIEKEKLKIIEEIPEASEELCCSKKALLQFERNLLEALKQKLEKGK